MKWLNFVISDKNEDSFEFLIDAIDTCEWIWHFCLKYTIIGFTVSVPTMCAISVGFCRLKYGNEDYLSHLFYPYRLMFV